MAYQKENSGCQRKRLLGRRQATQLLAGGPTTIETGDTDACAAIRMPAMGLRVTFKNRIR